MQLEAVTEKDIIRAHDRKSQVRTAFKARAMIETFHRITGALLPCFLSLT